MKSLYGIFALAAALSFGCAGGTGDKIVFATDATWPPMEFVNAQGELVGFDVDVVKAIAEAAGFQFEIKNVAWDGIFAGLANGQYNAVISSVTITEERQNSMDFSKPYLNAGQVLIVRMDSAAAGLEDLKKARTRSVGAQIGTTGAIEIKKHPELVLKEFDEIAMAFEALVNGVLDAVICDSPVAADFALQRDEYKDKLKIVGEVLTEEFYGIAVNKGDTKTLVKINAGLEKIKTDGTLEALKAKWGLK